MYLEVNATTNLLQEQLEQILDLYMQSNISIQAFTIADLFPRPRQDSQAQNVR